jgi:hypothetical protein
MSERQCHLPCGVSTAGELTTHMTLLRQREKFIPEEGNIDDEGGVS